MATREERPCAWNFAARFLLSAAVTAGVVSLFRNLSWSDGPVGEKVPMPLQMLPTLPPTGSSKVQRRVLKHSNGLCVRSALEGASLVLSDCGVMDNVVHISVGDEVQLHVGSACAVPEGKQIVVPKACNQREASYRKVTVGTDLFLLRPVDSEECLAPEGIDADSKPSDGTQLVLGDCQGESRYFQTSEAQATFLGVKEDSVVARIQETSDEVQPSASSASGSSNTVVHISGLCVTAQDEVTGEDSTVLMLQDCEDDPAKNVQFEPSGDAFRFQLGRQCGHAEDGPDASNEPRIAFPADCSSSRHHFKYRKMAEDQLLPGFVIQSVDSPVEYCIHPYGGSTKPPVGTELINHKECEVGREALRFRVGDPAQLAKEEGSGRVSRHDPCSCHSSGARGAMSDAAKMQAFYHTGRLKMFHFAEIGNDDEFEMWLNAVEDPNIKDEFERTPLHIAALMGHVNIAKALLDFRDCNCNAIDSQGRTPLGVALSPSDQTLLGLHAAGPGADRSAAAGAPCHGGHDVHQSHPHRSRLSRDHATRGLKFQLQLILPKATAKNELSGEADIRDVLLPERVASPKNSHQQEPKAKKPMGNPLIPVPQQEPCSYYGEGRSQSSRPGKPCIPPPPFWPYKGITEWKTHLGQRTLAAVTPPIELTERRCGSFYLLGDQTWCMKAFDGSHGYGIIGLSFGIEERDIWGELVTQKFKIPVKLYDCFIPPERSPPISKTAPNNTVCPKNHLGEPKLDGICYGAAYESFRLCLAGQDVTVANRKYSTLEAQLKGFPKLSVHLKIDVEGSEWDVLEWLEPQI
eukprot:s1005_g8.t1